MARLFIFAIGGTGSRVLKSLTMLLAAGVNPQVEKDYEIVPIIIDPHRTNEDLQRTIRLMDNYQSIRESAGIDGKKHGFFRTSITTLNKLIPNKSALDNSFEFDLKEVADTRFNQYIDYNLLDESNKALANILFSGTTVDKRNGKIDLLDIEMDIGFIGNPNIGSVVLNQFKDSEEFREFASNFNSDDRIFIISSIFGGTGAAGFPTILKNIRDAKNNDAIDGRGFLVNSKIGALTVLPYFNIQKKDDSPIQKSDFIAKTRAALYYYKDNVTGNKSVNALYYIGDDYTGKPYTNDPGSNGQKNDAHFVELAAALSIIDFMEIPDERLTTRDGRADRPIYKEFGIRENEQNIDFDDLGPETEKALCLRLSQLTLFHKYLNERFQTSINRQAWSKDAPMIDDKFKNGSYYKNQLLDFLKDYDTWCNEMDQNKRSFSPFDIHADLAAFIHNRKASSNLFSKVDYDKLDGILNGASHKKTYGSADHKILPLFFESTEELLTSKFGLKK